MGKATINQVVVGESLPVCSLLLVDLVGVAPDQTYQHLQLVFGRLVARLLAKSIALRPRFHRLLRARRWGSAFLLQEFEIEASYQRIHRGGHRVEVTVGGQTRRFRRDGVSKRFLSFNSERAFNNAGGGQEGKRTSEPSPVNGGRRDEVAVELRRRIIAAADIAHPLKRPAETNRECG